MDGSVVVAWSSLGQKHKKEFPNHKAARNFAAVLRAAGLVVTIKVEKNER